MADAPNAAATPGPGSGSQQPQDEAWRSKSAGPAGSSELQAGSSEHASIGPENADMRGDEQESAEDDFCQASDDDLAGVLLSDRISI